MTHTRNIVILGASFGGLGVAHYLAKHVLPQLAQSQDAKYVLHLCNPSQRFWWHIAAPRQIVSLEQLTIEQSFVPIMDGFKQYGNLRESIIFHHGSATSMNTQSRTITISLHQGGTESLDYCALVIATGIRSPTPLTTFHGDYTLSEKALKDMNRQLATAKDVVISGGGPVGVETAGEIAMHLKGQAKVTLYSGSNKILPVFKPSRAAKAQTLLEKAGVTVIHDVKVTGSQQAAGGRMELSLDNGKMVNADAYIPAHGVVPNTEFVPAELKSSNGYIETNPSTLRVDAAGPGGRVYAAGDVAGVDTGGVLNMYNSLSVLNANLAHDLLADAKLGSSVMERKYTFKPAETQLVPIGAKTGVAAFNGWGMPGFVVGMVKGKDYMLSHMDGFTEGKKFLKA